MGYTENVYSLNNLSIIFKCASVMHTYHPKSCKHHPHMCAPKMNTKPLKSCTSCASGPCSNNEIFWPVNDDFCFSSEFHFHQIAGLFTGIVNSRFYVKYKVFNILLKYKKK